jgi:hypothetical protein
MGKTASIVINKDYRGFLDVQNHVWKNMGNETKGSVYWIYIYTHEHTYIHSAVVRPIVTYAATVWWP